MIRAVGELNLTVNKGLPCTIPIVTWL